MIGRKVEWRNSFRDYVGVVVTQKDANCMVYELNDAEVYTVAENKLKIIGLSINEYVKYRERILVHQTNEETSIYDTIISELEELSGDYSFIRARDEVIANQLKLKTDAQRACISLQSDEKFQAKFSSGDFKDSKNIESKLNVNEQSDVIHKNNNEEKEEVEEEDEEEEEDNHSDHDDSSNSDDDSEEDEEEEEEESENDESDEEDSSEATSDNDTTDSNDEDEDEEIVDIKIYILPNNDIRGFGVPIDKHGLTTITKALRKDYGARISLFFRDSDGDVVTIKSAHDFQYAYRAAVLQSQQQESSAVSALANSQSGSSKNIRLKLYAEVIVTAASSTAHPSSVSSSRNDSNNNTLREDLSIALPRISGVRFTDTFHRTTDYGFDNGATEIGTSIEMDSLQVLGVTGSANGSGKGSGIGKIPASHSPSPSGTPTGAGLMNYEVMWKKGELLGRGSFGKVFSGINLSTGERMAIKEVGLRRGRKHKQQAQALQQEVKILSSLDHPHIIRYLGTEYTKQALRIFLELANEGTVKDALNEFGAFPEPLVRRYTVDILQGLHFLHEKKFIHRDIKPTNLLVSAGRVKLGDFGCSTASLDEESILEGGSSTTVAGTVVYMAPEVMQAGEGFDMKAVVSKQLPATITAAELAGYKASSPRNNPEGDDAVGVSIRSIGSLRHINRGEEGKEDDFDRIAAANIGNVVNSAAGASPDALQVNSARHPEKKKRRSYGKRSDIWSVGITLCEMALGKAPFSSAGAAIYAVCVSKRFPVFSELFSIEAHEFLSRCLVDDPKSRATCEELLSMHFLSAQSIDEVRAQTAATLPRTAHTTSNVTVNLPADFSFLQQQSPREGYDGMHSARSKMDSSAGDLWRRGRECKSEKDQEDSHSDMFASSSRYHSDFSARITAGRPSANPDIFHRDRAEILLSSDAAMFRSTTYANNTHTTTDQNRRRNSSSSDSEDSTYKNEVYHRAPYKQAEYKNINNSNNNEYTSYIPEDSVNLTILSSMALAQEKRSGYRESGYGEPPRQLSSDNESIIKECDDDEDCKTGYSTMHSIRDRD